jgi:hypothetical protein
MKVVKSGLYADQAAAKLLDVLISYEGVTSANGNVGGTTFVCADLVNHANYSNSLIKILQGSAAGQVRRISSIVAGVGTVASGFTDSAGVAAQILNGIKFIILSFDEDFVIPLSAMPEVQEATIYPVAPSLGIAQLDDDGTNPAYLASVITNVNDPTNPLAEVWKQDSTFLMDGTVVILSIFVYLEWQSLVAVGGGDATNSLSKIQVSKDGGVTWVDVTDDFTNPNIIMTTQVRSGVGRWFASIDPGANSLQIRLIQWTDDSVGGAGRSTSEAKIRSNSYIRIAYRKA